MSRRQTAARVRRAEALDGRDAFANDILPRLPETSLQVLARNWQRAMKIAGVVMLLAAISAGRGIPVYWPERDRRFSDSDPILRIATCLRLSLLTFLHGLRPKPPPFISGRNIAAAHCVRVESIRSRSQI
jgi:hypothetical protein